jgi:4-hydroxyphenylacetate 3-monooxygenase
MMATGSAITHYNFIAHYVLPIKEREFALVCTIPMGAPGMKLICRNSYSEVADTTTGPFDYPLSSRFDENDTVFIRLPVVHDGGLRAGALDHHAGPRL